MAKPLRVSDLRPGDRVWIEWPRGHCRRLHVARLDDEYVFFTDGTHAMREVRMNDNHDHDLTEEELEWAHQWVLREFDQARRRNRWRAFAALLVAAGLFGLIRWGFA